MSRPEKSKKIFFHRQEKNTKIANETVTVKLACGRSSRIQKKLLWKWSVCLSRTSAVTNNLIPKQRLYKLYFYRFISWTLRMMVKTVVDRVVDSSSWIKLQTVKYCSNTNIFFPVNTPRKLGCIMNWRFSATWVFLAFIT